MRKVRYKIPVEAREVYKKMSAGDVPETEYKYDEGEGYFHQWILLETKFGNQKYMSVEAVIEKKDGKVILVHYEQMQFVDLEREAKDAETR